MNTTKENPNLFFGTDTYGTHIEVGIRKDGIQFWRAYKYNGYGMSWSKWEKLKETKTFYENEYGKFIMKWGWNELTGSKSRIRLPKD